MWQLLMGRSSPQFQLCIEELIACTNLCIRKMMLVLQAAQDNHATGWKQLGLGF